MKTVYVVGGDPAVRTMFQRQGWTAWDWDDSFLDAPKDQLNLVCFTGGSDVSPHLYGEENTGKSYCNPSRDEFEQKVYEAFVHQVPMVGICRGGQFLNVMNGGKMIQHIRGHLSGDRSIDTHKYDVLVIREDHHQGIVPTDESEIIGWDMRDMNTELCFYHKTKCLCFQPHPEWDHAPTKDLFFNLLSEYLEV